MIAPSLQIEAREAQITQRDAQIKDLEISLVASNGEIERLKVELEAMTRGRQAAESSVVLLGEELSEAQQNNKQLIEELQQARSEAREVRVELDALKLESFRQEVALKEQVETANDERDASNSAKVEAEEQTTVWKARCEVVEKELAELRAKFAGQEHAHQEQMSEAHKMAQQAQRSDAEAVARASKQQREERTVLQLACADVDSFGGILEELRADVMRLTADNVAYAAEIAAYEEALNLNFELSSVLAQTHVVSEQLRTLHETVIPPLKLLPERQRVIDATEQQLEITQAALANVAVTLVEGGELEWKAQTLLESHLRLPFVEDELQRVGVLRAEALGQVDRVRDEADSERRSLQLELSTQAKQLVEQTQQAATQQELQAAQIDEQNKLLKAAEEELEGWRTGALRYIDSTKRYVPADAEDLFGDDGELLEGGGGGGGGGGTHGREISTMGGGLDQSGARMMSRAGHTGAPTQTPNLLANPTGSGVAMSMPST